MVKRNFSWVKFYADYESVIRNAKFALFFFFVHACLYQKKKPQILQIWSGKKRKNSYLVQFSRHENFQV